MSALPLEFPATLARIWVDSSIHMLSATTDFWAGLMGVAPRRPRTSTAAPWWMPPQFPQTTPSPAALWPSAFAANPWVPAWPGIAPFTIAAAAPTSNPFALWQQMWLQAAAPSVKAPWTPSQTPAVDALWQPVAAAYRTANGHAMAAVLRTMANAVEPKQPAFDPAHYWPSTLRTQH